MFGAGTVEERSRIAVSFKIVGVEVRPENPNSDYDVIEIKTTPTRGSRQVFASMFVREEQFTPNFNPDVYLNFESDPSLAEIPAGKDKPRGATIRTVYGMNVCPSYSIPSKGKNAGKMVASKVTPLMAIAGGTIDGLSKFSAYIDGVRAAGKLGTGITGIAEVINNFITENGQPEIFAILKQNVFEGKEKWEVGNWWGPVTAENLDSLTKYIAKTAGKEKVSDRVVKGFED